MEVKPKYNIGDKVYVLWQHKMIIVKRTIRIIKSEEYIDSIGAQTEITYGFEETGDICSDESICGTTEEDVYRRIDKHYNNEIKKINKEKQDTINKFKFKDR